MTYFGQVGEHKWTIWGLFVSAYGHDKSKLAIQSLTLKDGIGITNGLRYGSGSCV